MKRRGFLKSTATLASGAAIGLPQVSPAAEPSAASVKRNYSHHGRTDDYTEFRIIEPGRIIQKINPEWLQSATYQKSEHKA